MESFPYAVDALNNGHDRCTPLQSNEAIGDGSVARMSGKLVEEAGNVQGRDDTLANLSNLARVFCNSWCRNNPVGTMPKLGTCMRVLTDVLHHMNSEEGRKSRESLESLIGKINNNMKSLTSDMEVIGVFGISMFALQMFEEERNCFEGEKEIIDLWISSLQVNLDKTDEHLQRAAENLHEIVDNAHNFPPSLKLRVEASLTLAKFEIGNCNESAHEIEKVMKENVIKQASQKKEYYLKALGIGTGFALLPFLYAKDIIGKASGAVCIVGAMWTSHRVWSSYKKLEKVSPKFRELMIILKESKGKIRRRESALAVRQQHFNNINCANNN